MRNRVFLYKENGSNDRDCVKYIDVEHTNFECGHYFPSVKLTGACFSTFLNSENVDYNNITTILTQDEFNLLIGFAKEVENLGYGITEGDERYLKGEEIYNNIKLIYEKLLSSENYSLFLQVQQEEREYLKDEYSLDDEDVDYIFNNYGLEYRDRGIVSAIFEDIDDAAYEEAYQLGYADKNNDRYFNYETFGEDLLESENYLELPSGKIVYLSY